MSNEFFFSAANDRLSLLNAAIQVKSVDQVIQFYEVNLDPEEEDYQQQLALLKDLYEAIAQSMGKSWDEVAKIRGTEVFWE